MNYECKTIPGYENYECDIFGNVWSLNYNKTGERRKLKPNLQTKGYLSVILYNNGKCKQYLVHRLMLLVFCGESNLQVNHIDGIKNNNNLTNLEYCTASENIRHAFKTGLNKSKGEGNTNSKLTKKDVIEIKTELLNYKKGMIAALGRKYGVSFYTISNIKLGKTWQHVKLN
jgi:hypothetical protein